MLSGQMRHQLFYIADMEVITYGEAVRSAM